MVCPECGGGNPPDADRCGHCGGDLTLAVARSRSLWTARRAGRYAVAPLTALLIGMLLIIPLAVAAFIEMDSGLRLAPVPLLLAVLLAVTGFEILLRAAGRDPQATARRRIRLARRGRRLKQTL